MAFENIGKKFNSFFAMDAEDDEPEMATPTATQSTPQQTSQAVSSKPQFRGNKVVSMSNPNEQTAKIVVYEPRIYSDAKEIGTNLLNNKAVVVNFDRIENDAATRIVDFLTGTVFAINGEIRRIGEQIFLVTPANFQIDGTLAENLGTDFDLQMTE
ncbi:cell division protein SepF [Lacticaseibacillus porcinae]|uniref:cell division protein SepF n=1 Tax=Lacticaseibacillus porcinae TaxID=1123687 RepID=UPI000F7BA370|nr:cell division protein SepF [Lacticaseibacillus porcinae]